MNVPERLMDLSLDLLKNGANLKEISSEMQRVALWLRRAGVENLPTNFPGKSSE